MGCQEPGGGGAQPESPIPLPRFAKASVASSMGWRIFSTNTVSDLGTPTPPISLGSGSLTPTFSVSGVDLQLWAHEHSYERLWPIYNYQVRLREGRCRCRWTPGHPGLGLV